MPIFIVIKGIGRTPREGRPYAKCFETTPLLLATSKNYFLVIWVEDFDSEKVLETAEYFVYCAVFKAHL